MGRSLNYCGRVLIAASFMVVGLAADTALAETVLITGSNQGIGLEFAKQYAARGWGVIATHRRDTTPEALAELQKQYPNVRIERMDVSKEEEIKALAAKMTGEPIDIVINNAALIRREPIKIGDLQNNIDQRFGTLDYAELDDFVHVNVSGPLMIAEAFIENVKAGKRKLIVTISSRAGTVSQLPNSADHYWYRITKSALNQAMRLLTVELKDEGITVVMFHPGGVQVESFGDFTRPGMVPPSEAIGKMIKTIDSLTLADSGRFLESDGRDHPW